MTTKQIQQFNRMLSALKRISKEYKTPAQIRRTQETPFDFAEELEMVYENIQDEARNASHGVRKIEFPKPSKPGLGTDSLLDHGAY